MKSGVINRHDNAVRIALSAIRKGPVGASAIVADVLPRDDDVSDPVEDDIPRRLPVHLLTQLRRRVRRALSAVTHLAAQQGDVNSRICALLYAKYALAAEDYTAFRYRYDVDSLVFRPDLAIFTGGLPGGSLWYDVHWRGYAKEKTVHLVEVGYVREGFAAAKQLEKSLQHELLECLLQDLGWQVRYHTITLGVAGTVYTDALSCLRALQLSSSVIESVVRAWVHMTLNLTHGLVVQRRQLDGHYINKAFSQPP
jgi:hypothetical protein